MDEDDHEKGPGGAKRSPRNVGAGHDIKNPSDDDAPRWPRQGVQHRPHDGRGDCNTMRTPKNSGEKRDSKNEESGFDKWHEDKSAEGGYYAVGNMPSTR